MPRRVLAKAGYEHGASRAVANDDVVEFHHLSAPASVAVVSVSLCSKKTI
jgi:hypothetical protein